MRQETVNIYSYEELDDDAKQKARDWYTTDLSYDWWDSVYDDFERVCDALGITLDTETVKLMNGDTRQKPRIYFNGFYHQGSGSQFNGSYEYKKGAHKAIREYAPQDESLHEIADRLLSLQKRNMYRVTGTISDSGRYCSISCDAFLTDYINGGSEYADAEIDDELQDIIRDLNDWLFSSLEREYEYLTSDEVVEESIIANEYEFYENGEIA